MDLGLVETAVPRRQHGSMVRQRCWLITSSLDVVAPAFAGPTMGLLGPRKTNEGTAAIPREGRRVHDIAQTHEVVVLPVMASK